MEFKFNFNWKVFVVFAIVSTCLYILTQSFFMSLGIMMLLLLIDQLLAQWDEKRRRKFENREDEETR